MTAVLRKRAVVLQSVHNSETPMVVLILFKLFSQQVTERHILSTTCQQGAHTVEGFYGTQEHIISSFGDSVKEMTVFLTVGPLKCKGACRPQT